MSIADKYVDKSAFKYGGENCYTEPVIKEAIRIARIEAKLEAIDYYGVDPILKQPLLDNLEKLKQQHGL